MYYRVDYLLKMIIFIIILIFCLGKAASGWFIPPEWNNYTREFNTRKTHRNFKQTEIGLYDLSTDEEERINLGML